jgi:hypothetical protein
MADATIDQLINVESQLSRSFVGAVIGLLANLLWTFFLAPRSPTGGVEVGTVGIVLMVIQFGLYIWYAKSAGTAASAIGEAGWKYVVWILAAPFLAQLPIPIVSTLIAASPLAIKFLLGSQLQSSIRSSTFNEIHRDS